MSSFPVFIRGSQEIALAISWGKKIAPPVSPAGQESFALSLRRRNLTRPRDSTEYYRVKGGHKAIAVKTHCFLGQVKITHNIDYTPTGEIVNIGGHGKNPSRS
jgi:hypothetical protein